MLGLGFRVEFSKISIGALPDEAATGVPTWISAAWGCGKQGLEGNAWGSNLPGVGECSRSSSAHVLRHLKLKKT